LIVMFKMLYYSLLL